MRDGGCGATSSAGRDFVHMGPKGAQGMRSAGYDVQGRAGAGRKVQKAGCGQHQHVVWLVCTCCFRSSPPSEAAVGRPLLSAAALSAEPATLAAAARRPPPWPRVREEVLVSSSSAVNSSHSRERAKCGPRAWRWARDTASGNAPRCSSLQYAHGGEARGRRAYGLCTSSCAAFARFRGQSKLLTALLTNRDHRHSSQRNQRGVRVRWARLTSAAGTAARAATRGWGGSRAAARR